MTLTFVRDDSEGTSTKQRTMRSVEAPSSYFAELVAAFAAYSAPRVQLQPVRIDAYATTTIGGATYYLTSTDGYVASPAGFTVTIAATAEAQPEGDFNALLASIARGDLPRLSPERRTLVEASLRSLDAHATEDVDAWAHRLANSASKADD